MVMNVLCIGMVSIASLFSTVKDYFALPAPQENIQKEGVKCCQSHKKLYQFTGTSDGFKYAMKYQRELESNFPCEKYIKKFQTKIYRSDDRWICESLFTHHNDCPYCDEYQLVKEEDLPSLMREKGEKTCKGHSDHLSPGQGGKELFTYLKEVREEWEERTSYDRSMKGYHCELYKENGEWHLERSWTHIDNCPHCDCYDLVEEEASPDQEKALSLGDTPPSKISQEMGRNGGG